ncbi:MAG: hypothetical protein NXI25_15645 [bacterium]|nr:hypothetical protein [bacterium]
MKKVITTVGTSLFTNFMQDSVKNKYGQDYAAISIDSPYKAIENAKASAADIWNDSYKHDIRTIQENIEDFWFDDEFKSNTAASAEIASLLKIAEKEKGKVLVHLIATDTLLSVLAAELIVVWFEKYKHLAPNIGEVLFKRVQKGFKEQSESDYVVKSLQVDKQDDYEEGFMNLLSLLEKKVKKEEDILNITGGYKGIVPLLTLFGQIWKVETKYLFQEKDLTDEKDIITIGDLPFDFDSSFAEMYGDFLSSEGLKYINQQESIRELLIARNLIAKQKKGYKQTPLGRLFAQLTRGDLDGKKSFIGYFYELAFFEYFCKQEDVKVHRGEIYWWDFQANKFHYEPQFEKNQEKEKSIEVDLVVKSPQGDLTWYEVKSWSKKGLNKAYNQIKERIEFLNAVAIKSPKRFTLLLYKLPHVGLDYNKQILEKIGKLGSAQFDEFVIEYVEVPVSGKGVFNYKKLSETGIEKIFTLSE